MLFVKYKFRSIYSSYSSAPFLLQKSNENGVNIVTKVLQYWCDFGADKYRTQRVLQKCYIIVTILEHHKICWFDITSRFYEPKVGTIFG